MLIRGREGNPVYGKRDRVQKKRLLNKNKEEAIYHGPDIGRDGV